ncbi:MAG: hypothetical protein D6720_06660 [Gammaproteobacteria bacterium]|nr:MAG: hypothetical protein D6720_06660 [Gammaproteobacteria bacterium]
MANPISGVKLPSFTARPARLDDENPSSAPNRPRLRDKDKDDAVRLESTAGERLERPLSQRLGSVAQARAAVERLRGQLESAPAAGAAAHRLGETEVEALLTRPPTS